MKADEVIGSIKEFLFDVMGFLIPGFTLILLICFSLSDIQRLKLFYSAYQDIYFWPMLVASYLIGYAIYGLAIIRDSIFDHFNEKRLERMSPDRTDGSVDYKPWSTPESLGNEIKRSLEFILSFEILKETWGIKPDSVESEKFSELKFTSVRGGVMSYIPKADSKIHSFMFRSELCNHLQLVTFLVSTIAIILIAGTFLYNTIISWIPFKLLTIDSLIFRNSLEYFIVYILLFFSSFLFHKTRIRFLRITYRVPFSIFISEYHKLKDSRIPNNS